jgi:hypothetical protein
MYSSKSSDSWVQMYELKPKIAIFRPDRHVRPLNRVETALD